MKLGNLYKVKKYFFTIHSSEESIKKILKDRRRLRYKNESKAKIFSLIYSIIYSEKISYLCLDTYFILTGQRGKYKKIMTTEGKVGWIFVSKNTLSSFEEY